MTNGVEELDAAIWKRRELVRAWCMRSTLFLVPSEELSIFVRGSSRRPAYNLEWALTQVSSRQQLDKLLDAVLENLNEPRTRAELAKSLQSQGYRVKLQAGGGWGNQSSVPFVEVGGTSFSVGSLLRTMGARDIICSGPSSGNESTFIRADKWLARWKDIPTERAEDELLEIYLRAFGPATLNDFALWLGVYVRDAKEIWQRKAAEIAQVEVDDTKASILESDLTELEKAKLDEPVIRLLPNFDSYLLGHKSHHHIVDEGNLKQVYQGQGWISSVLLVDGRSLGVWSFVQKNKSEPEVRIVPFSPLSTRVRTRIKEEVSYLGRFLGSTAVRTVIE